MKKIVLFTLTVYLVFFSNNNVIGNKYGDTPQKIIVAGKIDNYDSNKEISMVVNRIGFRSDIKVFYDCFHSKFLNSSNFRLIALRIVSGE